MKINPNDWTRAQELLVKLVQVLGPLADKGGNGQKTPLPLPSLPPKAFFPGSTEEGSAPLQRAVQLLTALQEAKGEVDAWIGDLPGDTSGDILGDILRDKEQASAASLSQGASASTPSAAAAKEKTGNPAAASLRDGKPIDPVGTQAQRIIDQVRQAIYNMSSSTHLLDPKPDRLRDALKKLKPLIDQLIDAVSQEEGMHTAGEDLLRFKALHTQENPLRKTIPFPSHAAGTLPQKEKSDSMTNSFSSAAPLNKNIGESPKGLPSQKEGVSFSPLNDPDKEPSLAETGREPDSLPAAPYTAPHLPASRKKTKKRKNLWDQDEEDPADPKDR